MWMQGIWPFSLISEEQMGVSYFLWKRAEGQGSSCFPWLGRKFPFSGQDLGSPVLASAPSHVPWVSFYQPQTEMLWSTWPLSCTCPMSRSQKTVSFPTMSVVQPTVWSRWPDSLEVHQGTANRETWLRFCHTLHLFTVVLGMEHRSHLCFSGVEGAWHLPNLPFLPSASVLLPINCPLWSLSQVLAIISHILQMQKGRHREIKQEEPSPLQGYFHMPLGELSHSHCIWATEDLWVERAWVRSVTHSPRDPLSRGWHFQNQMCWMEHSASQEQLALLLSSYLQSRELLIQQEAEWV